MLEEESEVFLNDSEYEIVKNVFNSTMGGTFDILDPERFDGNDTNVM